MIEIKGLEAGYGKVTILRDVNINMNEGELVALVGSNGAGKTTLLRSICGCADVTSGEIRFLGERITGLPPQVLASRGLIMVPEGRQLFPGMTVRENLLMGAFARRDSEIESDLAWVLDVFPDLTRLQGHLAGFLSGGQQQMCAIGRGILAKPKLLLLDELSLGLAPVMVDRLISAVEEINRRGITVLMVEQDVHVALDLATRGYVLETGRIAMEGEASALLVDDHIRAAYLGI